jgi:probable phosphoglycerate mutase
VTLLGMIRHGRTAWNGDGRLTGRTDIPLTEAGRQALTGLRPPAELADAVWHVSPLRRARETAAILGGPADAVDERLIEMNFGSYEGRRLLDLRDELGPEMTENEDRGLDFLPPGGESPRMVQQRLRPFLAEIGGRGGRHIAVAHKAVIRAVFAAAYDWPMLGKPPVKLHWEHAHLFTVDGDGAVRPHAMNTPLVAA